MTGFCVELDENSREIQRLSAIALLPIHSINNQRIKHVTTAVVGVLTLLPPPLAPSVSSHPAAAYLLENLALRPANQQTVVASIELRMEMNHSRIL